MSNVGSVLSECASWTEPRSVQGNPFRLTCHLGEAAKAEELAEAWPERILPTELREFWMVCREAALFVDDDYGQWGLKLLSPAASAARSMREQRQRPSDFSSDDIVLGEFLGDQDLLVLSGAGAVLVALPIDSRADWYSPATSLAEFFGKYIASKGEKFWESRRSQ